MRTTASLKDCSDAFDSLTGFACYGLRPGIIPDVRNLSGKSAALSVGSEKFSSGSQSKNW
jgi:hypothetical protein